MIHNTKDIFTVKLFTLTNLGLFNGNPTGFQKKKIIKNMRGARTVRKANQPNVLYFKIPTKSLRFLKHEFGLLEFLYNS